MMMTDQEIKSEVLKRTKRLDEKNKKRKRIIYSCIPSIFCAAILIGTAVHFSNNNNGFILPPENTEISGTDNGAQPHTASEKDQKNEQTNNRPTQDEKNSKNTITLNLFVPSVTDPDYDSFGEDGLAHVDIVLNGSIIYKQISLEDYPKYGFSTDLKKSDFGQYLGNVIETHSQPRKDIELGADDPALAGSKVYFYKPVCCRAAVIVQKDKYCSIFVFGGFADQDKNHSIAEQYSLFGADSSEEISFLSYTVIDENNKQSGPHKVLNREKIKSFYVTTASLIPYEITNPKAPTPDWLNDAYEAYRNLPQGSDWAFITVEVHFKNGLVLKDISYLPYLTTGYVADMNPLTPEQNSALKASLSID